MRCKKLPQAKKPNPYKGARLGQGWHEEYILDSRIANENNPMTRDPKPSKIDNKSHSE